HSARRSSGAHRKRQYLSVRLNSRLHKRYNTLLPSAGILIQTLDGKTLLEQNSDIRFNPASVMKVATSFTALEKLGFDYRFPTTFNTNGHLSQDGVLYGDLIIGGSGDPGFFSENLFLTVENLHKLGIKEIDGDLLIVTPFYFNFGAASPKTAYEMIE